MTVMLCFHFFVYLSIAENFQQIIFGMKDRDRERIYNVFFLWEIERKIDGERLREVERDVKI